MLKVLDLAKKERAAGPSGNDHEHEEEQEVPEGAACRTGIHRYYRVLQRFC